MSAFLEPLSSCNEQAWVVIVCMDRLRSRVIYKFVCRARRSRVVYEFVCAGVMLVTSVKRADIFPHVLEST